MGGCADCFARAAFGILTLFTIGVATGGTIALLVIVEVKRLYHASDAFQIGLIVATAVVSLVFIFAVYASCCGGRTARFVLGALFLFLTVAFAAFGWLVARYHGDVASRMGFLWADPQYEKVADAIERMFHCHCFDNNTCDPLDNTTVSENTTTCLDKLNLFIEDAWIVVFGTAIGVVGLLIVAAGVAFCYACQKAGHDGHGYRRFPMSSYNTVNSNG
jgi:hypothetical protein